MATLDQILDNLKYESTRLEGLEKRVTKLEKQRADEVKRKALTPAQAEAANQTKIDEIFALQESNRVKLDKVLAVAPIPDEKVVPKPNAPTVSTPAV